MMIRWLPGTEHVQPGMRCKTLITALLVLITVSRFRRSLPSAAEEGGELSLSGAPGDSRVCSADPAIHAQPGLLFPSTMQSISEVLLVLWCVSSVLVLLKLSPEEGSGDEKKSEKAFGDMGTGASGEEASFEQDH